MFLGYQNNIATFIANSKSELENKPCVSFDRIEEVEFAEMFNGVIYISEEELNQAKADDVRAVRNSYLEKYVDPKQLVMVWDGLSEDERQLYANYRTYLLEYTELEDWYLNYPMIYDEWLTVGIDEPEVITPEANETATNEEENAGEVITPTDESEQVND